MVREISTQALEQIVEKLDLPGGALFFLDSIAFQLLNCPNKLVGNRERIENYIGHIARLALSCGKYGLDILRKIDMAYKEASDRKIPLKILSFDAIIKNTKLIHEGKFNEARHMIDEEVLDIKNYSLKEGRGRTPRAPDYEDSGAPSWDNIIRGIEDSG